VSRLSVPLRIRRPAASAFVAAARWLERARDRPVPTPPSPGPALVGDDVWLGRGAVVHPGVRIGDGAVVAAYSVVTEDVAPGNIVAGNPARRIDHDAAGAR
jgi:acetyltransferase-like isoleucine patch superfamily enzyme